MSEALSYDTGTDELLCSDLRLHGEAAAGLQVAMIGANA
jgi:hypothetical protein